jgi:hypothetical protein
VGQTALHVVLATLGVMGLSALVVEGAGAALTQTWPALPTHLAAAIVALALGYATIVTGLLRSLLHSLANVVEWMTGELEEVTDRAIHAGGPSVERAHAVARPTHAVVVDALPHVSTTAPTEIWSRSADAPQTPHRRAWVEGSREQDRVMA